MGNAFESFRRKYFPYKGRVVLAGEYGSGRTTALYKMRLNDVVKSIPTIGFNVENLHIGDSNIEAWDIGGNTNARRLWHHYFQGANGLAFFIDLSQADEEYQQGSKALLNCIMGYKQVENLPVLVVCNKKDIAAISVEEAVARHELHRFSGVKMKVVSACSLSGEGLREGFDWLVEQIIKGH